MLKRSLWPLFLVSGAAVGFEIALTRYFAVAKWSEYGYWVISIVMAGFALSGVAVALGRDAMIRHGETLLAWLPPLMILAAAIGYWATTINPFNPLQLQNAATYAPQLINIGLYYAALLPFFFLAGLYVSLSFVLNGDRIGIVYGYDLTGAGAGAALVLVLMFVLHPFSAGARAAGTARTRGTSPCHAHRRHAGRPARRRGAADRLATGRLQRFQSHLCAHAYAGRQAGGRNPVATRTLRDARRLHRARRHRRVEQCRYARRSRPAAILRPIS